MDIPSIIKPHKIFADALEAGAVQQFSDAMKLDCVVRGALMPDAHQGYALPIGAVVATEGMIFPSWVGYDIGCGMLAVPTTHPASAVREDAERIFQEIYNRVPVGFEHNKTATRWMPLDEHGPLLPATEKMGEIFRRNGLHQLGSLGGGNHFIEIGADESDQIWIVVHSGSRGIGHATATHHMRIASGDGKAREGHFGFSVDSEEGKNYIADMEFCLQFALSNRREIASRVLDVLDLFSSGHPDPLGMINRNHNHAEKRGNLWIHRKGATHAESGMMGVVPGNMRDGSFVVRGKGNPDALWSSSHGAGRVLGRKEAQRTLSMENFRSEMHDVTALVTSDTLDESPSAYKNIFEVMDQQRDLVDVVAHIKPIVNVKG